MDDTGFELSDDDIFTLKGKNNKTGYLNRSLMLAVKLNLEGRLTKQSKVEPQ